MESRFSMGEKTHTSPYMDASIYCMGNSFFHIWFHIVLADYFRRQIYSRISRKLLMRLRMLWCFGTSQHHTTDIYAYQYNPYNSIHTHIWTYIVWEPNFFHTDQLYLVCTSYIVNPKSNCFVKERLLYKRLNSGNSNKNDSKSTRASNTTTRRACNSLQGYMPRY